MAEARITEFFGDTQIREEVLDFMGLGSCMPREAWRLPSPQKCFTKVRHEDPKKGLHAPMILAAVFSQNSKCRQKGVFSREMTYFFGFYGPKIGGGSSYPKFVQKYQKL